VELDKAFEQKGQYPPKHEARAGSPGWWFQSTG